MLAEDLQVRQQRLQGALSSDPMLLLLRIFAL